VLHAAQLRFDRVDLGVERHDLVLGGHVVFDVGDVAGDSGEALLDDAREDVDLLLLLNSRQLSE
jgi:hypothetical protein